MPTEHVMPDGTKQIEYGCGCVSIVCEHNTVHTFLDRCENRTPSEPVKRCYGRTIGDCDSCCTEYEVRP